MPTIIKLSFPSNDLSPNNMGSHWGPRSKARKKYNIACWVDCLDQTTLAERDHFRVASKIFVHLEFVRPANYGYDEDNLVARMKSGLDGIAEAIKVDDVIFRLSHNVAEEFDRPHGHVIVTLTVPGDPDLPAL